MNMHCRSNIAINIVIVKHFDHMIAFSIIDSADTKYVRSLVLRFPIGTHIEYRTITNSEKVMQ